MAVIKQGRILGLVPKKTLSPDEKRFFVSGENLNGAEVCCLNTRFVTDTVFVCKGNEAFRFAVCAGTDIDLPYAKKANIVLHPCADAFIPGGFVKRLEKMRAMSEINGFAEITVLPGKGESTTDNVYGGECIIAECGSIIASVQPFSPEYCITEIDTEHIEIIRKADPLIYFATNEVPFDMEIDDIKKLSRRYEKNPYVPEELAAREENCRETLQAQSHALAARLQASYSEKCVIGISGGLDSALALIVCVEAMKILGRGAENVIAVTMPCFGTTGRTRSNAETLCNGLGVTFREIVITESVKRHLADIGHDGLTTDAAYENAQARERTQVLMDLANIENGLVVGTGDLSELALGWATYNGDHMSMYSVNASIPKTQIRIICSYYAKHTENKSIRDSLLDIIDTPVSPELLPSKGTELEQKTEDIVGPYELHDFFIYHFVKGRMSPAKILFIAKETFENEYDGETIEKWLRVFLKRFFSQQFKRSCSPDGPKVGPVTFSPRLGLKMPSDAPSVEWISGLD